MVALTCSESYQLFPSGAYIGVRLLLKCGKGRKACCSVDVAGNVEYGSLNGINTGGQRLGSFSTAVDQQGFLATPVAGPLLYTVTAANRLAAINVNVKPLASGTSILGVTQDSVSGPVRRIRGLAYDSVNNIKYGLTREGDLVTVNSGEFIDCQDNSTVILWRRR